MSNEPTPITTVVSDVPQLQTVMQDGLAPISTVVNAPWVNVTSVNGMTGDVVIELVLDDFQPNHYYAQNTAIIHNGSLYYAKTNFTSGAIFNINDWNYPQFTQEQVDWNITDNNLVSYIKNKPTKLSQFTNDKDYATTTEVNEAISTGTSELTESVDNLIGSVSMINTSISDITSDITSIEGSVSTLNESISSLETTVDNMKTDGSVTKLGTNTVGSVSQPIYLDNGTPTITSTSSNGVFTDSLVTIDSTSKTITSDSIIMKNASGTSLRTLTANSTGLLSDGNVYVGSVSENNRLAKVSEISASSGEWTLIGKYIATSGNSSNQIYASVPTSYRGYPWEYKVRVGFEIAPAGGDVLMTCDGVGTAYSSALSGFRDNSVYNEYSRGNASWAGLKWPCTITNDSCSAEILFTRAGSSNFWAFYGIAGGFSGATPSTITFGGRIESSSNITYFNLNKSNSSGVWLTGSHIEIYARKYN